MIHVGYASHVLAIPQTQRPTVLGTIDRKDSMPGLSFILQTLVEHCEIKRQALPSLPKDPIWSWGRCYDRDYSVHKEPRYDDSTA